MKSRTQRVLAALTTLTTLAALLLMLGAPPESVGASTTQNNGCLGVTGTFSTFAIPVTGAAAPKTIDPGQKTTLSGTGVTIAVDAALVSAGVNTGLVAAAPSLATLGTPDPTGGPPALLGQNAVVAAAGSVKLQIKGTNTTEGTQTATNTAAANITFWVVNDGTTITIYTGTPNPPSNSNMKAVTSITVPIPLADTSWTAAGGNIALTQNAVVPSSLTAPTAADKAAAPLQILPKINGFINVPFYCWPGGASADGTALVPGAVGNIDTVTVTTASTSSTSSSSTSSTSSTSTTSTSSTSTTSTSTTSTTAPPTSTTSTTAPEPTTVQGKATYATDCTNSVTKDHSNIPFTLNATGPKRAVSGDNIVISGQSWTATVPGSVLQTAINLGLLNFGDTVHVTATPNLKGTNTDPADNKAADVAFTVGPIVAGSDGNAQDTSATFPVGNLTYRATGGDATFAMSTTKMLITIGALKITFTCTPVAPVPVLLTTLVTGPQLPTTTTTTEAAAVLATTTELPRTGPDSRTLWIEVVTGLLMIQIGYILFSITKPGRKPRRGQA